MHLLMIEYPKHGWHLSFGHKRLCYSRATAGTFILNLLYLFDILLHRWCFCQLVKLLNSYIFTQPWTRLSKAKSSGTTILSFGIVLGYWYFIRDSQNVVRHVISLSPPFKRSKEYAMFTTILIKQQHLFVSYTRNYGIHNFGNQHDRKFQAFKYYTIQWRSLQRITNM